MRCKDSTAKSVRLATAGTRVTLTQINPALCFETISLPRNDLLLSADIIKLGRAGSLRTPGGGFPDVPRLSRLIGLETVDLHPLRFPSSRSHDLLGYNDLCRDS